MCGFVGAVFRRPLAGNEGTLLKTCARTLQHRGPDSDGLVVVEAARTVLAFQRLAIIDLSTGDQPMGIAGHHIVFNGEIYNYRDIRTVLESKGVSFTTGSDTEVLLRLIATEGLRGLERTRGMFGFAYLDTNARTITLARDRLGVKQVYYAVRPEGVFFASEPKALLALPWVPARMNESRLAEYFAFRSVPAPETLYADIRKVRAGSYVQFDLDDLQPRETTYWSLAEATANGGDTADGRGALDRFEDAFVTAIRRRLVSDVPVGAFLSGGLDSSLIVAGISRLGHKDVETFSATFPGSPDDEASFSAAVSQRFGLRQHTFPLQSRDFLDALPRWIELNDDPVADASSLPLMRIADVARREGRIVMLSGEGADELFGGYGSYHKYLLLRAFADVVPSASTRRAALNMLVKLGVVRGQDTPRVREYFVDKQGYMGTAAVLGASELAMLLPAAAKELRQLPTCDARSFGALGAFDFQRRIPDDLLVRTDRATMGASVEARVPFLDHDLVELAATLPARHRSLPGVSKVLLRRLARRWGVPTTTLLHRKIGFQLPIGEWFRGPLRETLNDAIRRRAIAGINYDYVRDVAAAHMGGRASYEEVLWRVLTLEAWHARWIEGNPLVAVPTLGARELR